MIMYRITKNNQQIGFMFGIKQSALLMLNSIYDYQQSLYQKINWNNEYSFTIEDTQDTFQINIVNID